MIEELTTARIASVLAQLADARHRATISGHHATEAVIEAAVLLIQDLSSAWQQQRQRDIRREPPADLHWSPFDTEVRD